MTSQEDGEGELAGDLVGTVSARLLAAGIPRDRRLAALRLLGALDTLADRDDRVRRPLSQVGAEFDLPPAELESSLDALVEVGAVDIDGGGIVLLGREMPTGGIRLQDFLAVVAELDEHPRRRQVPTVLRPAAAVLVAAALVAAVILTPGVVQNRPAEPTAAQGATSSGSVTTSGRAAGATTTAADSSEVPQTLLPPSVAAAASPCPTGTPVIEVLEIVPGTTTSVTGIIRNSSSEPLAVTAFTLIASVSGQDVTSVPGTTQAIPVPGGESAEWRASLPATPAGTTIRATLDHWEWVGAAARCPAA